MISGGAWRGSGGCQRWGHTDASPAPQHLGEVAAGDKPFSPQSMFAVGWLELKEVQRAQTHLNKCFSNITEPFKVSAWRGCFLGTSTSRFCLACSAGGRTTLRHVTGLHWWSPGCCDPRPGGCTLSLLAAHSRRAVRKHLLPT